MNAPGRLRFDFTTPAAVPHSVLGDVEDEINEVLLRDLEVRWFVTDQDEARRLGAIAMFGEKYGDRVRIVEIGDYSRELCGGTHVPRSSVIGMVKLLGESSIGSGVRRVEALVGLDAFQYLAREHVLVQSLATEFKAQPEELPERINGVLERLKGAERELAKLRVGQVLASAGTLAAGAEDVNGVQVVAAQAPDGVGGNDLRSLVLDVRGRLRAGDPAVVLLASPADGGGVAFVAAVNDAGQSAGLAAGELVRAFAPVLGARGGGKADLAQGAGGDAAKLDDAFAAVKTAISAMSRGDHNAMSARAQSRSRQQLVRAEVPPSGASGRAASHLAVNDRCVVSVDVGTVRVGVARSDPDGILASPLATLARDPAKDADIAELAGWSPSSVPWALSWAPAHPEGRRGKIGGNGANLRATPC